MSNRRLDAPRAASAAGEAGLLRPIVFSTADHAVPDQFAAYAARCAGVVEVEPVDDPQAGFAMHNRVWVLDGMALSCLELPPVRYMRTPALVRRDPVDHWTIAMVRRGRGVHHSAGQAVTLPPGRMQLGTMAAPFAGERGPMAWQMLFLARDSFPELAGRMDSAVGAVPEGALAGLLADFLLGLEAHLGHATEAERPALSGSIRAMVAACLAPSRERLEEARMPIDQALLDRAKAIIRANLGAALLGPRMLCRALGLSRSRLYRLFEAEGGVARHIQRQRLLAARAALTDPANALAIGPLAEQLGFADPSVFSRAYRAEFGITPRETRMAARAGHLPAGPRDAPGRADSAGLLGLLRAI